MPAKKTQAKVIVKLSDWIALCQALEATPDIGIQSLITKARRLVESRKRYAQNVITLEGKLLKKCPEMDQ